MEELQTQSTNEPVVPVLSELDNENTIDWQKTLGYMTDVVTAKTIANTTQFYPTCVESEVSEYPRQHHQKHLHALYYSRIPGRTCADTFFSSIKSIRGLTCVQLFVATTWAFLWIKLLRRESQVPGAYLDFCKEVGAPKNYSPIIQKFSQVKNLVKSIDKTKLTITLLRLIVRIKMLLKERSKMSNIRQ